LVSRRIAGSLGRPPRLRVIVLSLPCGRLASTGAAPARKARSRDGAVASRSTPAMKPAHLLTGTGWSYDISKYISVKEDFQDLCATCAFAVKPLMA
jgi:hypothetical protein